jgi:regulation of enolase protein 1 (concanavalin A-like superfamily)
MSDVFLVLRWSKCATRVAMCFLFLAIVSINPLFAQSVPAPWATRDIGSPGIAGSSSYSSGTFTVEAAGRDIWDTSDQFRFVYQQITGDTEIVARVDSLVKTDEWSKTGVMIRASLYSSSAHAFALVSAANGIAFQRRSASGAMSEHTAGPAAAAPRWVRLTRIGTTVTAATSADGVTWTTIGSDTIALGSTAYVGLATTSHDANRLTTAVLSQVRIGAPAPSSSTSVPAPQKAVDIGSPALRGSVSYSSGTYTVNAAGLDIWNSADQFYFIYQQITGDVDLKMRVRSVSQAHSWSKTGVMIRESLSPGSRHAFALLSAAKGYAFHRRIDPNGFTEGGTTVAGVAPGWVRLVRTGSRIEAFRSSDGTTWRSLGSDVVPMVDTVYVGIATTSHNTSTRTKAVLDNFKVTASGSTAPTNVPPTVALSAPANGATYAAPASMTLSASASDSDGTVSKVEFYSGTTLLGSDTTAPYSYAWSSVPAGSYSITAVAYDNAGAKATSAARSISVTGTTTTVPTAVAFHASADHAIVTSYRFDVFASGANPATATPVKTANLGKPTPNSSGDITVNELALFTALAVGNYQATVTAIGSGGSSRSAAVAFTR